MDKKFRDKKFHNHFEIITKASGICEKCPGRDISAKFCAATFRIHAVALILIRVALGKKRDLLFFISKFGIFYC
jgi:hypothetical protein